MFRPQQALPLPRFSAGGLSSGQRGRAKGSAAPREGLQAEAHLHRGDVEYDRSVGIVMSSSDGDGHMLDMHVISKVISIINNSQCHNAIHSKENRRFKEHMICKYVRRYVAVSSSFYFDHSCVSGLTA